jgi:hypothetical protein
MSIADPMKRRRTARSGLEDRAPNPTRMRMIAIKNKSAFMI